ncbi:MAG: hypothetical protein JO101_04165 [Candidatus Eremiobacteraeota bacterium]|nr:hypothetical protein [Candidatus Eremiobacteraeota bacterium]MBV8531562.1 hypothetical protein [Candidatus Eremiobacteraeota bacterium]
MVFLVKDLLVSVLCSDEEGVDAASLEPIAAGTTVIWVPPFKAPPKKKLRALKDYLRKVIDEIDREGEAFWDKLQPDTLEEVKTLQTQFDKAQAKLTQLRKKLRENI